MRADFCLDWQSRYRFLDLESADDVKNKRENLDGDLSNFCPHFIMTSLQSKANRQVRMNVSTTFVAIFRNLHGQFVIRI